MRLINQSCEFCPGSSAKSVDDGVPIRAILRLLIHRRPATIHDNQLIWRCRRDIERGVTAKEIDRGGRAKSMGENGWSNPYPYLMDDYLADDMEDDDARWLNQPMA